MLDGMLVIDKPAGITSFDVIRRLRRILSTRALGHTGTLDPAATGVLCVCVGWGLKLIRFLPDDHKVYDAVIQLGRVTTTDDAEGEVVSESPVDVTEADLRQALSGFVGLIEQVPPAFSAIKVDGKRAYAQARKGHEVKLAARPVRIDRLELEGFEPPRFALRVTCGKGTYIRSLARDLGAVLECGAHLATLRRTESGVARIEQALTIDQVAERVETHQPLPTVSCWDMLSHLPGIDMSPDEVRAIGYGQRIRPAGLAASEGDLVRLADAPERLFAVGQLVAGGEIKPIRVRPQT